MNSTTLENVQSNMIGKRYAHKSGDNLPVTVGKLVRFEQIKDCIMPILQTEDGKEYWCVGIVFEYTPFIERILNTIPVYEQYQFLSELKLSFNCFRDMNTVKHN